MKPANTLLRRGMAATVAGLLILGTASIDATIAHAEDGTTTTIAGVVTVDSLPRSGATVCASASPVVDGEYVNLEIPCALTDGEGRYAISFALPASAQFASVWVRGTDTYPQTGWGDTPRSTGYFSLDPGESVTKDIDVTSFPVVSGRVVDRKGRPIAGATLSGGVAAVKTSRNGRYAVRVAVTYSGGQIDVSAAGYRSALVTVSPEGRPTGGSRIVLVAKRIATAKPRVAGTAKIGNRLTVRTGTWGPQGVALSYQWYRNGRAIPGATTSSYTLSRADRKKRITVVVTGALTGFDPVSRRSAPTKKVRYH